jgi:hypothetical protein
MHSFLGPSDPKIRPLDSAKTPISFRHSVKNLANGMSVFAASALRDSYSVKNLANGMSVFAASALRDSSNSLME